MESKSKIEKYGVIITTVVTIVLVLISVLGVIWISNPDNQSMLESWIGKTGILGWFIIIFLQFVQIVIAPIPAEPIEIISGSIYGVWGGLILNVIGSIPASIVVFGIGNKYGKPFLDKLFGKEKIDRISILKQPDKFEILAIIILLIPAAPKDIISYICGLSSMKKLRFVVIATLARIPSTLMCTMVGDSLHDGEWEFAVIIAVAMVLFAFIGLKCKDKLLKTKSNKKREEI